MAKIYEFTTGKMVADTGDAYTFNPLSSEILDGHGFCTDLEMDLLDMSLAESQSIYTNSLLTEQAAAFHENYMSRVLDRMERSTIADKQVIARISESQQATQEKPTGSVS